MRRRCPTRSTLSRPRPGTSPETFSGSGRTSCNGIGIWNTVDDVATTAWNDLKSAVDALGHFLRIGGNDKKIVYVCIKPSEYYANYVLASCYSAATAGAMPAVRIPALDGCL